MATAALDRGPWTNPGSYSMEAPMRLGMKTALLSAAIGALSVSAVGSAHAEDLPPGHNHESRPAHAGESHDGHSDDSLYVTKYHRKKYFSRIEETSRPAPVAEVPADALCSQSVTTTGGDATTGDAAATGGAATTTATQTQTCNITVNLPPVGSGESNQIRTETRTTSFIEEDRTKIRH